MTGPEVVEHFRKFYRSCDEEKRKKLTAEAGAAFLALQYLVTTAQDAAEKNDDVTFFASIWAGATMLMGFVGDDSAL